MSKVVLICSYGLVDKTVRTEIEYQGLVNYYTEIYNFLKDLKAKNQLSAIVFCGGYRFSQVFESNSSQFFFNSIGDDLANIPQFVETVSGSTIQNLALGYLAVIEKYLNPDLLIICDSVRQVKVQKLSEILFKDLVDNFEIVSFDRQDIHLESSTEGQIQALKKDLESTELQLWQQILQTNLLKIKIILQIKL